MSQSYLCLIIYVILFDLYHSVSIRYYSHFIPLVVFMVSEIWFVELRQTLMANTQSISVSTLEPSLNLLLINALNKYHPFIFYSSVGLLAMIFLSFPSVTKTSAFAVSENMKSTYKLLYYVLAINGLALYLGSWWALQEGTWGGWWTGSSVLVFYLLYVLLVFTQTNFVFQSFDIIYF